MSIKAQLVQTLNRLDALSLRERVMLLLGVPLLLLAGAEWLLFDPARKAAAVSRKQGEQLQVELKALSGVLAAQPAPAPLPGADQLLKQRNELQDEIDAARSITGIANQTVDWGTVVRATVAGTPGLTLTQLKTMPAELVFGPSMVKPGGAQAASASAPQPAAPVESIYRHRAELTVKGEFGALLEYVQSLQRLPGELRWERLQLGVAAYPQASVQLTLYTLSNRAETPFN